MVYAINQFQRSETGRQKVSGQRPSPAAFRLGTPSASGAINNLNFPDGLKAKSRMQLYRLLDEQPSLLSDPSLNTFKNVETGTSIGAFYAIEKAINNLPSLSTVDAATVSTQTAILQNALNGIWQVNQSASPNATQRDQYFGQASAASSQIQTITEVQQNSTALQIGFLKTQNGNISATESWEVNQKMVNGWTLASLNGEGLVAALAPSVLGIASQCPLEGGDAVYQARGLYGTFFDALIAFDDHALCAGIGQRQNMGQKAEQNGLVVYPNPTDDALFVKGYGSESVSFELANCFGQILKTGQLNGSPVSTADLIPGIYWLSVSQQNARTQTVKVVISR